MQGSRRENKFSLEDALEGEKSCAVATGRQQTSNIIRNTIMMVLKRWQCYFSYSGAFANLRKANISFVMPVCPVSPSVRMEKQRGSHWTDFQEISYLSIFQKPVKEIQVSLKSDKK
jgi:hypothetical protein